jgi:hypothetical protein
MSNTNTGGPAFPCERQLTDQDVLVFEGMTLRDYFAAKAMQGLYFDADWRIDMDCSDTAYAAYAMADAMLRAREEA